MQRLLQLTYKDRARADREIAELTRSLPSEARSHFDLLLAAAPAPEQGLHFFARLFERQPGAFRRLTGSPTGLRYLVAIFT